MEWLPLISYFFGGLFLTNAVPHVVSGLLGQAFQTPFANPPGQGRSTSVVNVLWGAFNLIVSYLLLFRVGAFDFRATSHVLAIGSSALLGALWLANHFGQFNGGNSPE
jgi:hypothetical protein